MKGGWAKFCLACGKAKQRVVGAVWEGGEGLNGTPMGELTGLVRELVGEMRGFREELREVKEVVEKGLKNVAKVSHLWHRTTVTNVLNYAEWWAGFPQEEMDREYQELWLEDGMYWKYLKERIDEGELDTLVNERVADYELEGSKVGAGPEDWVSKVDLEE